MAGHWQRFSGDLRQLGLGRVMATAQTCISCLRRLQGVWAGRDWEKKSRKKYENRRLTEVDPKTKKPRLKAGVSTERAVEVLYMFENTDVLPYQIEEMKVTIANLQARVKKLEDWQE